MSVSGKPISSKLKSKIMSELSKPDSSVAELSKLHGVSNSTLYKWKDECDTHYEHSKEQTVISTGDNNFIELTVQEDTEHLSLKSASLQFGDFSLALEGKITSDLLIALVKTVEDK
jgi:transposase-like protein